LKDPPDIDIFPRPGYLPLGVFLSWGKHRL
jgi:hypothetical protein